MKRPETTTERSGFRIAAPARLQALRLTAQERARLTDILRSPETDAETRRTRAGHFVSRLGPMKRVLWTRGEGQPTVLSIADQSYAAGIVGQGERERFDFRRTAVSVQGVPAQVLTYDEMVAAMTDNLEIWRG